MKTFEINNKEEVFFEKRQNSKKEWKKQKGKNIG